MANGSNKEGIIYVKLVHISDILFVFNSVHCTVSTVYFSSGDVKVSTSFYS